MKLALYLITGATLSSMSLAAATYTGGMQQMQNSANSGEYMYRDNYGNMYRAGNKQTDQQMYNQYQGNNAQNQASMDQTSGMMSDPQTMRNDQELLNRVRSVLESKKGNFYPGINVGVKNNTVTLSGVVQTEQERNDLKSLVQKINGVSKIDDQLYVRTTLDKNLDQMLAQRAADALQNGSSADGLRNVQVSVRGGVITLLGTVELDYQKRDAQNKILKIPGVKSVDNQIKVKSK